MAKRYFQKQLEGRTIDNLLELKSKLDEHTKVLTYSVTETAEATLIFETTNDRGKGLTNLEKIKSFLMYKTYLAASDDTEKHLDLIRQRFSEIFRDVEMFDGQLEEDTVLQYHCIAFESWTDKEHYQQPVNFIRNKLNPLIKQGKKIEALKFIERFSLELRENFRIMRELLGCSVASYRDLVCMERIANFYPLLLKSYKFDDTDSKDKFKIICRLLEIFSFRVFAVQQNRSHTGQASIYTITRDFVGRFGPLNEKLIKLVTDYSSRKSFRDALGSSSLYEWMGSRDLCYLIWKYENHLREKEQPICASMSEDEFRNTDRKTRLTVEHIAAQTQNGIVADTSILPKMDEKFVENNLHRLGNLTFDPASANSSKGNNKVVIKNSKYFSKAPYKTQNELESFLVKSKWTSQSIVTREAKIVKFCMSFWDPEGVVD
ncbi:MAG: HNH endonuclease family protein [Desulfosporosinus sp.]|nr:HNH endonuclease family protein [Desulfosporosinus sp.]